MTTRAVRYMGRHLSRFTGMRVFGQQDPHGVDVMSIHTASLFPESRHTLTHRARATAALLLALATFLGDGKVFAESLPTDCDNSGTVDLTDFAAFAAVVDDATCGESGHWVDFESGMNSVDSSRLDRRASGCPPGPSVSETVSRPITAVLKKQQVYKWQGFTGICAHSVVY